MKFKLTIASVVLTFLTACASNGGPTQVTVTENFDRNEKVVSKTVITTGIKSKHLADLQGDQNLLDAQKDIARSKAKQMENVDNPTAQVAIAALDKLKPDTGLGMTSREYNLAVKKENTNRLGLLGRFLPFLLTKKSNQNGADGGLVVSGNNNTVQGVNTGDNSSLSYTEGLPVSQNPEFIEFSDSETVRDGFGNLCSADSLAANGGSCP